MKLKIMVAVFAVCVVYCMWAFITYENVGLSAKQYDFRLYSGWAAVIIGVGVAGVGIATQGGKRK